jgi:hypothetical protein
MSRRIIPGLCALALAVPASAVAMPAHDQPATESGPVAYGDTKYDLQNQRDQKAAAGSTAYEQAISGDTKGNLPRAVVPGTPTHNTPVAPHRTAQPTASTDDSTDGWQIAALAEAAVLGAFAIGGAALLASRQHRAPRVGV